MLNITYIKRSSRALRNDIKELRVRPKAVSDNTLTRSYGVRYPRPARSRAIAAANVFLGHPG